MVINEVQQHGKNRAVAGYVCHELMSLLPDKDDIELVEVKLMQSGLT